MKSDRINSGRSRVGHPGGAATFEHNPGVWLDQIAAQRAAQERAGNKTVVISEGVAPIELFLEAGLAAGATELPVEGVEIGRAHV